LIGTGLLRVRVRMFFQRPSPLHAGGSSGSLLKMWYMGILIAVTALTRFVFRSRYLYDIDSVNFALALKRFDPSVHQPHPPGYFLYVCLGRLVNLMLHDGNAALVAMSIVFSCGLLAAVYTLADNWFGPGAAPFAGLIFVFSPLAWFHGTVALTYIVEAFFSSLTGYLCWRIYSGSTRFILPAAIVLGIAAGFRPSSLLLLGPLFIFSILTSTLRQIAEGVGALSLMLLAWFVPMLQICGRSAYFSSLASLWLTVPSKAMVFNSSLANSLARAAVIVGIYFLCFGCAAILPFTGLPQGASVDRRKVVFSAVWVAPGLLFFTFVYLKFVNSGYLLILVPPICAWMGKWLSTWYSNLRCGKTLKILAIAACASVNALVFIYAPVYCSYLEVRRFEAELESVIEAVPQIASPRDTVIVGFDSHFLGYRHAGYYLPRYLTVQFPEVELTSGKRIFAMKYGDTRLTNDLNTSTLRQFIMFPLPSGDREYSGYMAEMRARFPGGDLTTVARGGHRFSIGPVADLRFLFPVSGRAGGGRRDRP